MAKKKTKKIVKKALKKKAENVPEIKIDLSTLNQCPQCGSDNIFYSRMRDELVCRDCGGITSKLTPEQMKKFRAASKLI